ncbi:MAG: SAM-dependent methyltransferase [Roseburia sp.]|nr:SAM-dependent methyltransferase [Roseburia sp.]MCM1096463.1 SAM-dependent methyltransferase [Ruminococcus flavefaciens]MCM1223787.1 SAM-dependent methyltransferase [Lachnospiraceae bacterium]MCM1235968.1 SAM-dependent methyltransferase [Ruminococcus flavefaciens]
MAKSIEEQIEDWGKKQLGKTKYYTKTESINPEIESALKTAPSKSGGKGTNYPDIKLFIETGTLRKIPVVIEVKGTKGALVKRDAFDEIDNTKKDGTPNFTNINRYAVNGAVHYANAIVNHSTSYREVIAVGLNGYDELSGRVYEIETYYVSLDNYCIPKRLKAYADLSFLLPKNIGKLIDEIDKSSLTEEELEAKAKEFENEIEINLKKLNQVMQDDLKISVGSRVELVTGMIMASLGVEGKVAPLEISDLKGDSGSKTNDGQVIINKIDSFLEERNLPQEKKKMIINDLLRVFVFSDLWKAINGESKLKTVYTSVKNDIMPIFTSARHLDFTGRLFNVLNAWVDIPDGDKNDVVLTPRYVTELMAKLAQVNKDSYVWDYAAGSAGFLISSMKLMIKDAEEKIKSPKQLDEKIAKIKCEQLLGIEKRADIYLLAVLNMILMGDGSSNILHEDSLTEYSGNYEQGERNGEVYPANVFLLNPPYSAPGKGFVFVEKALNRMRSGRAIILIQENAGSGNGLPYTKRILERSSLVASIHMSDIFHGKAGVQTAIYVFNVGIPHDERQMVKFIDFSNDGYTRQNRKKSSQDTNLKNTDHALERYEEVVNLVLYGKSYLHYFTEEEYVEDVITLEGNDWTFKQHQKVDTIPTKDDFKNVVKEYLAWKVSMIMEGEISDENETI